MKKYFITIALIFITFKSFAEITIIQEINDLLVDKLNGVVVLISTLFTSIGALITWILTKKHEQNRAVSLSKKRN